jgi:hypothetical protein
LVALKNQLQSDFRLFGNRVVSAWSVKGYKSSCSSDSCRKLVFSHGMAGLGLVAAH